MATVKGAEPTSGGSLEGAEGTKGPRLWRRSLGATFERLWWATAISATGDGLLAFVAIPLLALTITGNPVVIAGLTGANRASRAIAALPGGVVTDRWDRRNVMIVCNLAAGLTLLVLVGAMTVGWAVLVMLYIAATVLGACDVTYTLAVQASLPEVVSADRLAVANGRLIAVEGAGEQLIGPAVGGILFSFARRLPFSIDAASFFGSVLLISTGWARPPKNAQHRRDHSAAPHPPWVADFRQGFNKFWSERALKLLATMAAMAALSQTMVFAIFVLYGKQTLHLTTTQYGLFLALAAAVGVAGAQLSGHLQNRFGSGQLVFGGFSLSIASYIGLAFTHWAVLAVFVFGLQEIGTVAANVGSVTARQRIIPRQLYGRVGSVHRLAVQSAGIIGAVLGGLTASAVSIPAAMLIAGVLLAVALAVIGPWLLRSLRVWDRPVPTK